MKSQKWLSINFFTFFFTWGVFLPYWTGWLMNAKDLTAKQAGFIMGVGMIVRALSTLILYPMATRLFSISKVMQLFGIASLVAMLFYVPFDAYIALLIVTVLFSAIYPNMMPGMESSATILIQKDRVHYGKSRAYGSLGYTIALVLVGGVTQLFGIYSVLWVMIAGLALIVVSQSYRVPAALKEKVTTSDVQGEKAYTYIDLVKEKGFFIVIFIAILIQGSHATYYNFGYVYLDQLKISGFAIGLILNVAVIIEILFFAKADKYFNHMKVSTMYLIAGIGASLRWALVFLFPSVGIFIVSQLLHAVSFGVAHFAFVKYISERIKPGLIPLAQGAYAAFAMSFSVALLTFLGSYLFEIKPGYAFVGMLICTIPAFILTVVMKKKYNY